MGSRSYIESASRFWKRIREDDYSSKIDGDMEKISVENALELVEESEIRKYELPLDYWGKTGLKSRLSIGLPTVKGPNPHQDTDFMKILNQGEEWNFEEAGVYTRQEDKIEYEAQIHIEDDAEPPRPRKISFEGELDPDTDIAQKLT